MLKIIVLDPAVALTAYVKKLHLPHWPGYQSPSNVSFTTAGCPISHLYTVKWLVRLTVWTDLFSYRFPFGTTRLIDKVESYSAPVSSFNPTNWQIPSPCQSLQLHPLIIRIHEDPRKEDYLNHS